MTKFTIKKYASPSVNQLPWALQILGFNLIELMVVITLIGILSLAATLSYTKYIAQGNLTEALGLMNHYQVDLMGAYGERQQFPTTIGDLTANTYTAITYNTVNLVYYGIAADQKSAFLRLYTTNTGIAGAIPANPSNEGAASRISLVLTVTADGHFNISCGQWDNSSVDVPVKYLPNSCNSTNLSALIT